MLSPAGMHGMAFNSIPLTNVIERDREGKRDGNRRKKKYKSIWVNFSFVQIVNDIFVIGNH